jgi:hypothetical protein
VWIFSGICAWQSGFLLSVRVLNRRGLGLRGTKFKKMNEKSQWFLIETEQAYENAIAR